MTAEPGDFLIARDMVRAEPFAPDMEGGSAAGFRSIASQAELLHLVHLALRSAGL